MEKWPRGLPRWRKRENKDDSFRAPTSCSQAAASSARSLRSHVCSVGDSLVCILTVGIIQTQRNDESRPTVIVQSFGSTTRFLQKQQLDNFSLNFLVG